MSATRKVVISECYGGFGLSWAAMQKLAERKGLVASYFAMMPEVHAKVRGSAPVDPDDTFTTRVIGPRAVTAYPAGEDRDQFIFGSRDIERDDPDLVAVVEELGGGPASAKLASLSVVEIPADVEWEIGEYDGYEWVQEKHRRWP